MTKKRLIGIVAAGTTVFFLAAMLMTLWIISSEKSKQFQNNFKKIQTIFDEYYTEYYEKEKDGTDVKKANITPGEMLLYDLILEYNSREYASDFAVMDFSNKELLYVAKNFIRITFSDTAIYCDLDDYLTQEIINELIKTHQNFYYYVKEVGFYIDGNNYIPTELVLYNWQGESNFTYKLSDYPTTVKYDYEIGTGIDLYIYETVFYNKPLIKSAQENLKITYELNKDESYDVLDGGGWSLGSGEGVGDDSISIDGKAYRIFYSLKNNSTLNALFSDSFYYWTVYLFHIFIIAGTVFLIICLKIWKKGQSLDEARKTFISAASHELKTPLAVIQNQCECILENVAPEKNTTYINSIYDEALRMNSIVNSLLSYNRISQLTKTEKSNCDISSLLKKEIDEYRSFSESSGAEFIENIAENVYAPCNAEMMKIAIDNLLSNAVKYSVGDKKINITLENEKKGFLLTVSNPADEKAENIGEYWDILTRGDTSRSRDSGSVGMGLPLCHKIFELHSFKTQCVYEKGHVIIKVKSSVK